MEVIGISGRIAAGKTTAARHIESMGYAYRRYSLILASILEGRGITVNREALQEVGMEIHLNPGQEWLNMKLFETLGDCNRVVIDGLRHPQDDQYWREKCGPDFLHVYIHASDEVRLQRYLLLGKSKPEFDEADAHPVEHNITSLMSLASTVLVNESSKEHLFSEVTAIVPDTKNKGGAQCQ